ncbi:hypothetical protein P7C73_g6518, partial [Tremellales sp. Uapishka_1]
MNSPRMSSRLPPASPFLDLFFPSPTCAAFPAPHTSPFPSHSLDNTTWAARNDIDRLGHLETSSSSSEDEVREQDWGMLSGVLVKGDADGEEEEIWTVDDEEKKVIEVTDTMMLLFQPDEEVKPKIELNQLDNRPAVSDTSSIAESSSTATAHAISRGQLKANNPAVPLALPAWTMSSPAPSPTFRPTTLPLDYSPTPHLKGLRSSFEADDSMDVDEQWIDETGELPVKAEDAFSDIELNSTLGDGVVSTPEHDRQLHTAIWAREAAIQIKEEPEDCPSPITTDPDQELYHRSRESSTLSHTPSSRSSELPQFDVEEVLLGPESVTLEELDWDNWLPNAGGKEKTPYRGRNARARQSGNWGGIGVGNVFVPKLPTATATTTTPRKSLRSSSRRNKKPVMERKHSIEMDAIGPDDLELAKIEAEAKEEESRRLAKERADKQEAMFLACRYAMKHASTPTEDSPMDFDLVTPPAVDPKALLSPPILDFKMSMLDEVLSQTEVDAVMGSLPPPPAPPPVIVTSPPGDAKPPILPTPHKPKLIAPKAIAIAPAPIPIAKAESPVVVEIPAKPRPSKTAPASASVSTCASPSPAPSIPPTPAVPPTKPYGHGAITKALCPGIDACVVDNIPVYAHILDNKDGGCVVLRRLDTDFVNGTSLLFALGIPSIKAHSDYLNAPSPYLASHHTVPTISPSGIHHSSGVAGVWVPLVEAREYTKKLGLKATSLLSNVVREDLFQLFAQLAGLKPDHSASENFGLPFVAKRQLQPPPAHATPIPTPSTSSSTSSLSSLSSSTTSKSTPNLSALSLAPRPSTTKAVPGHTPTSTSTSTSTSTITPHSQPATPTPHLIRPAQSLPEGCPQPKRRRNTIVCDQKRSTRASVGGGGGAEKKILQK